jgi:hypothetical protein
MGRFQERIRLILRYSLRGALGFGAGGLFVVAMEWFVFFRGPEEIVPIRYLFGGYFLCGAFGAIVLMFGLQESLRGALGFGLGFMITGFMVLFTMLSLQASAAPEYVWSAWGCGLGFAVGGAMGGIFIRFELALAGAISFGLAGALWGPLLFSHVWQRKGALLVSLADVIGVLVIIFPYAVGGALFGAALGCMLEE